MEVNPVIVYTDGSCNAKHGIGAWGALLFIGDQKVVLTGIEEQTTHQRMELLAVIKSFEYLAKKYFLSGRLELYTDSQYVTGLSDRASKLKASDFKTKSSRTIRNADLVRILIGYCEMMDVHFIKLKAHHKSGDENSNREVDLLVRKIVRQQVNRRYK
jgi:ribonuclease HI